jgi:hypothetical protein
VSPNSRAAATDEPDIDSEIPSPYLQNLATFADDTPGNLQSLFDRTPAKSILRDVSPVG